MASNTPVSRDRYVDFLRAFSITTVVLGHWFIALIWWRDGPIVGVHNAVGATSGLWLVTWVLQVMPLFFFVGGFSNFKTLTSLFDRGRGYRDFLRTRSARLLRPTAVFVGVWLVAQGLLHALDIGGDGFFRLGKLPFGPLWFLFVYMFVIALTPVMLWLHQRGGLLVAVALAAAVVVGDVARFGFGVAWAGWPNLAWVWLFSHQLGFFYADGTLIGGGRRLHLSLALGGIVALGALTNIGVYPRSMVGTDVERISNMNPPTLCILALTLWLVGGAMLLRQPVTHWLQKKRPWTAVIAANGMIMTVFLWHLTAYLLTILILYPLGLGRPTDSTASWWLQRPVWLVFPGLVLALLVAIFERFERRPL